MDVIHDMLNIIVISVSVLAISLLLPFYLVFRLFSFVRRCVCEEDVAGKVVLITGAASGIGEHVAYEYAKRKARLALVDIREERLPAVAETALSLGSPDVISIDADVSNIEDSERFVQETLTHFGKLDHLVNNAGIGKLRLFDNISRTSDYTNIMDVNFWGSVHGTKLAVPHLKKSRGKIVVIASSGGWFPFPGLCFYGASKAAVISFFETLRTEIGDSVGITIVTPGFIKTDMTTDLKKLSGPIPLESTERVARAIVRSACRGDMYLTEPSWVWAMYPWKILCPRLTECCTRWAFVTGSLAKQKKHSPKART